MAISFLGTNPDFVYFDISEELKIEQCSAFGQYHIDQLVFNTKNIDNMLNGDGNISQSGLSQIHSSIMRRWRETVRNTPDQSNPFGDIELFQPVGMVWDGERLVILHYAPEMNDLIKN